jgi:hypothetical protein
MYSGRSYKLRLIPSIQTTDLSINNRWVGGIVDRIGLNKLDEDHLMLSG